jgi:hypothetical protein
MVSERIKNKFLKLGNTPGGFFSIGFTSLSVYNGLQAIILAVDDFQPGLLHEKWNHIFTENFPDYDISITQMEWLQKQYISEDAIRELLLDTIRKFGQSLEIES